MTSSSSFQTISRLLLAQGFFRGGSGAPKPAETFPSFQTLFFSFSAEGLLAISCAARPIFRTYSDRATIRRTCQALMLLSLFCAVETDNDLFLPPFG